MVLFAAFGAPYVIGQSAPAGAASAGPFDALHFRQIGPAGMSGRIADLAVYEANPSIFYVAAAHGGVWKTTNGGTTFEPQMQDHGLMSIGDVTVSQSNPDLVWVGTGESNNRQSTGWGDGVFKSTDGGKTYTYMGLKSSLFINRIVIDPRNNDVVLVAATGSLWGPGGERGVFKTADGGKTWKAVLTVDADTGANDLVMDPTNNRILYASTYQRRRSACCMNGGGPGSGIWKSTDAGDTWTRLKGNGLPDGPLGRIGLDVYRRRPDIVYALIEGPDPAAVAAARGAGRAGGTPDETPQGRGATTATKVTADLATGLYRSDDAGAHWKKVNDENPRPMYFSQIRIDPNDPDTIIYAGVKLHHSTDGGKTVTLNATQTIHDDVHAIWWDPANSQHVLIGDDGGLAVTYDQTKTWNFFQNLPIGLFYHVSVDMATPYHICGGMQDNYVWCGPSAVRGAAGIANYHWQTMQGGDGFVALQDPTDFRIAYSESQDGNMVRIDRVTGETESIRPQALPGEPALRWNWDTPLALSPHDPKIVYAVGNKIYRSSNHGLNWEGVSPDLTSNANRDEVVTMGVKGSDVTISKNDGIEQWPTVVSFAESPKRPGLLYAGTDDGHLQVSRDTGRTWTDVMDKLPGLPKGIWVSEVVPSRFDEATVYATFDGHRQNDFNTWIYASHDYGQTWQSAAANLKDEVVKTLTEDPRNGNVLYIGTETGLFVSLDKAKSWQRIKANLPDVRIDEITIHPRDNAMILATHGRALWILDHLEPIQEYAAARDAAGDAKLFSTAPSAMYRRPARDRNYEFWGDHAFFGENPPQDAIISWVNKKPVGEVALKITDAAGRQVREIAGPTLANSKAAGIQSACWDLRVQPAPPMPTARGSAASAGAGRAGAGRAGGREGRGEEERTASTNQAQRSPFGAGCEVASQANGGGGFFGGNATGGPWVLAGTYSVALVVDGKTVDSKPIKVVEDPEVALTSVERKRMYDMAMEMHEWLTPVTDAVAAQQTLTRQIADAADALGKRTDVPADVTAQVESLRKDLAALAPRLTPPQGRGGGRGSDNPSVVARIGQAKNGLMGGMPVTEQTTRAYTEARSQAPKAIADLNAILARASTVSTALARYNVTLTVPPPVKAPAATPTAKRATSAQ
ncbi:MAG TPA: hypothetical protein VFA27_15300 [Vicinamibacterales bacterium]|nr:hypothetical protein [Vicinamibacterales bacterium]